MKVTESKTICQIVDDLRWVITSPVLIDNSTAGVTWINDQFCSLSWRRCEDAINDLRAGRLHLANLEISEPKTQRLGEYFEYLVALWFTLDPHYQVLDRNKVIFHKGRTVGELDLVLWDIQRRKTIHIEVAVKFYLHGISFAPGNTASYEWFGPGLRDRLDKKYDTMQWKQIGLSKKYGLKVDESWGLLKGRLYARNAYVTPWLMAPYMEVNQWMTMSEFNQAGVPMTPLSKAEWFSGCSSTVERICYLSKMDYPVHMQEGSHKWCFIVPDNWLERAGEKYQKIKNKLIPHYQSAVYEVEYSGKKYQLQCSDFAPNALPPCCIVTAYNPGSERLSEEENQFRNKSLYEDLKRMGLSVLPALGRSQDATYREYSWAVLIEDREEKNWRALIMHLMALYSQRAVLLHQPNQRPEVLWC